MAKIKLNNNEYSIPNATLIVPRADFIAHLAAIEGDGIRVVVDGVEYNVDPSKVADAVAEIEALLESLNTGSDEPVALAAGLYETGSNYSRMIMSWDELVANNMITIDGSNESFGIIGYDTSLPSGDLVIAEGCEGIVGDNFYECESITALTFPTTFHVVPPYTVAYWPNLTKVVFKDGLEAMLDCSFDSCTALTSIELPVSLMQFDGLPFGGCTALENIVYAGTIEQWNMVDKMEGWNENLPATYVQCSDGQVAL